MYWIIKSCNFFFYWVLICFDLQFYLWEEQLWYHLKYCVCNTESPIAIAGFVKHYMYVSNISKSTVFLLKKKFFF